MSDPTPASPSSPKQVARTIAAQLKEPNLAHLIGIVKHLGPERALEFLAQTLKVEAEGGLKILNGARRRTAGGTFFHLVRESLAEPERSKLFPPHNKRPKKPKKDALPGAGPTPSQPPPAAPAGPAPEEAWAGRAEVITALLKTEIGKATAMKVTLIGRPGKVSNQGQYIMFTMRGPEKTPSLPKGLPPMPAASKLVYLVYVAEKQWKKVAEAIQAPEDVLIVEGHLTWDEELKKLSIFASNITTKALEQAKRVGKQTKVEATP
ncbi:MAG: hypothetical protein H0T73_10435 [Ardenticatenales bacterium]|nr:hypothetical protein [Ardenticatenales bacterium]